MMRRTLAWLPVVISAAWLATTLGLEAFGVYSYHLRAPWLQSLVCLLLALLLLPALWQRRGRPVVASAAALLALAWAVWRMVQVLSRLGGWDEGSLSFLPAMLLLLLAGVTLRLFSRSRS